MTFGRPFALSGVLCVLAALTGGCPSAAQVRQRWLELADEDTLAALAATDPRAERDLGLRLVLERDEPERGEAMLRSAAERAPGDPLVWLALAATVESRVGRREAVELYGRAVAAAAAADLAPDFCAPAGLSPGPSADRCVAVARAIEESAARLLWEGGAGGAELVASSLLESAEARPSFPAAHVLRRAVERRARREGDGAEARRQVVAAGCLLDWRFAGPFGPRPLTSFELEHPPERDATLASSYDLGLGRGVQPTRDGDMSACSLQLTEPLGQAGTWYAEAGVRASASGPIDLRLWAPADAAVVVWVGGVEAIRRDGRVAFGPAVSTARVQLGSEPTRVLVKLTSGSREPGLSLAMRELETGRPLEVLGPATGPWPGRGGRAAAPDDPLELLAPAPGEQVSSLRAVVAALAAQARGHWTLAEEVLARVRNPGAPVLLLRGQASARSPAAPRSVGTDRLLSDMGAALDRDPRLYEARLALAGRLADDGQGREALALLLEGVEAQPGCSPLWHQTGVLARRLRLDRQAAEALRRAHELDGASCESLRHLALMYDDLGLVAARDRELEALASCDASSRSPIDVFARTGRVDRALGEMERLADLAEHPSALEPELAELELRAGRTEDARRRTAALAERWPRDASHVSTLADLAGAEAGPAAAAKRMGEALRRRPWEMSGLGRAVAVAGGERELEAYRVDGLEHVRRFEASGASYDAPTVYVLDRAVYRVYPDLSTLRVVHQIVKVLAQDAVGGASEFRAPEGGEILTLRTIKPDGTILEPLEIDAEGTTNLTGVEVGDHVETEYVSWGGPSRVFPGGLVTPRFYFATPETAMHLSELIVLAPADVPVRYVPRGPSPPRGEAVRLGGLVGRRFAAARVPSQITEPDMPSPNETYPSVAAVVGESPEEAVAAWHDGMLPAFRPDFRMRRLVRGLRRPGRTEEELARALYGHVLDNVQPARGGSSAASHSLAAGRGDPLVLLAALYRLAGFETDLVYAWGLSADRSGPYRVPAELTSPLVRVRLDGREHLVSVGSRHAPFGHLSAGLRGQPALVVSSAPEAIVLPSESPVPDAIEVAIEGELGSDGTLTVELVERYTGVRATVSRSDLNAIPAAERESRAAAMLGAQYPGAVAEWVRFEGIEDRDAPLEVRGRFASRGLLRMEGRDLLVPARLAQMVRYSGLARLSARRTPLVHDLALREVVTERIRLPDGARVLQPCESAEVSNEMGSFSVTCSVEDGVLVHRLELTVPPQRIEPRLYPAFAAMLRRYDEAAGSETRLRLP